MATPASLTDMETTTKYTEDEARLTYAEKWHAREGMQKDCTTFEKDTGVECPCKSDYDRDLLAHQDNKF